MKNFVISLLISAVAIMILAYLLPGVAVNGFIAAVITALVIGMVNGIVKPIFTVLTIPVTILTLGLFLFVINALMILLADMIVPGFEVDGFWWALLFSVLLSFLVSFLSKVIGGKEA